MNSLALFQYTCPDPLNTISSLFHVSSKVKRLTNIGDNTKLNLLELYLFPSEWLVNTMSLCYKSTIHIKARFCCNTLICWFNLISRPRQEYLLNIVTSPAMDEMAEIGTFPDLSKQNAYLDTGRLLIKYLSKDPWLNSNYQVLW